MDNFVLQRATNDSVHPYKMFFFTLGYPPSWHILAKSRESRGNSSNSIRMCLCETILSNVLYTRV
jgi:hypothetical protein